MTSISRYNPQVCGAGKSESSQSPLALFEKAIADENSKAYRIRTPKLDPELVKCYRYNTALSIGLRGVFNFFLPDPAKTFGPPPPKSSAPNKVSGFVVNIPGLRLAPSNPDEEGIARLEEYIKKNDKVLNPNDPKLIIILKRHTHAFTYSDLVALKDIADKMNGLKNPSAINTKVDPNEDKKQYEFMKKTIWIIEGHTDSQGTSESLRIRSEQWADGAKRILVAFGVDERRLKTVGYGKTHPAAPEEGNDEQIQRARALNRRLAFRIE